MLKRQFFCGRANQPWKEVHVVSLVAVANMTISYTSIWSFIRKLLNEAETKKAF